MVRKIGVLDDTSPAGIRRTGIRVTSSAAFASTLDPQEPFAQGPDPGIALGHQDGVRDERGVARAPLALRNRALLLVGHETALRRSELVGIRLEHLGRTSAGVRVAVPFSSGDPTDHGAWIELLRRPGSDLCPVAALGAWRAMLDRDEGPLFVALRRARYMGPLGDRPLSAHSVARIVSRAAKLAGLEGRFNTQSPPGGGAIVNAMGPRTPLD